MSLCLVVLVLLLRFRLLCGLLLLHLFMLLPLLRVLLLMHHNVHLFLRLLVLRSSWSCSSAATPKVPDLKREYPPRARRTGRAPPPPPDGLHTTYAMTLVVHLTRA